jgi:hypothetical protein
VLECLIHDVRLTEATTNIPTPGLFVTHSSSQVGRNEVAGRTAMLALRYNGSKEAYDGTVGDLGAFVVKRLAEIQQAMLAKATKDRNAKLKVVRSVGQGDDFPRQTHLSICVPLFPDHRERVNWTGCAGFCPCQCCSRWVNGWKGEIRLQ